jgi:hypothetical protein
MDGFVALSPDLVGFSPHEDDQVLCPCGSFEVGFVRYVFVTVEPLLLVGPVFAYKSSDK